MGNDVKKAALIFLKTKVIAVLATIDSNNYPHAATIYYASDDDFTIYFATKTNTHKYQNIEYNHKVALVVGTENIPVTLQLEGEAEKIEEKDEKTNILARIANSSTVGNYKPPINKLPGGEIAVFKVKPISVRFLDQTGISSSENRPIQIIP